MKKIIASILAVLMVFLGGVQIAFAQWDYGDDYTDSTYGYETTADAGFFETLFSGLGIFIWVVWCCLAVLGLGFTVFRIIMLIHAIRYAPDDQKILWILLLLFVPIVDFVYFFTKRKEWGPRKVASPEKKE